MAAESTRKHAGPPTDGPIVPEPSFAERARTLLHLARVGTLSTVSRKQPGYPFGSVMPFGLDDHGRPIFLISSMAMHTQNLQSDPKASLLVAEPGVSSDPLGSGRVTLIGKVGRVPDSDRSSTRDLYLARHENSRYWVDFEDFAFYRMDVIDLYYVGGFGVMGWVEAGHYGDARPDPLADDAAGILEHMNADHADALILLARNYAGIEAQEATMTSVDRLGFNVRLKTPERIRGARIAFLREATTPTETRKILVEMVKQARQG
jgi:heme iron utilization protein